MTDNEFRDLLIAHRNRVASLTLTDEEHRAYFETVARGKITAAEYAGHAGLTYSAAHFVLEGAWRKGYVSCSKQGRFNEYRPLPRRADHA